MYLYSFLRRLFSIQFHIHIQPKCEISDIIHFYEIQIILKPSKSYNHYRNCKLCRVPRTLLSVLYRALGKGCLCRVPKLEHSTKARPSAKLLFAECSGSTLGKDVNFAKCSEVTLSKDFLCRVSTSHTRQILAHR